MSRGIKQFTIRGGVMNNYTVPLYILHKKGIINKVGLQNLLPEGASADSFIMQTDMVFTGDIDEYITAINQ